MRIIALTAFFLVCTCYGQQVQTVNAGMDGDALLTMMTAPRMVYISPLLQPLPELRQPAIAKCRGSALKVFALLLQTFNPLAYSGFGVQGLGLLTCEQNRASSVLKSTLMQEPQKRERTHMKQLQAVFSPSQMRKLMNIHGFKQRLKSPSLVKSLKSLLDRFSAKQIVTLMSDSVAARLESPSFMEAFEGLFDRFSAEQIVTLMSNSLAARLESPSFMEAFNRLFDKFSAEQIATLMSNSVATRLESPSFMEALNRLFDRFSAEQIATLMSNSVAARLESPSFMEAFKGLFDKFSAEQIVTLMSDSVAARLESPSFLEELLVVNMNLNVRGQIKAIVASHPVVRRSSIAMGRPVRAGKVA